MRVVIVFILFLSHVYAQTLDILIDQALRHTTSLEVIKKRIEVYEKETLIADNFANPVVALTTNTLDSGEKMSQTVLSLRQKIYFCGKREEQEAIAKQDVVLERAKLQKAKVALVYRIKVEVYRIWEIKHLIGVTNEYIDLTEETKRLYESYTASDEIGKSHMGLMSAELSLSELKIKKTKLEALEEAAYKRLSYLVGEEVGSVSISLDITNLPSLANYARDIARNADLVVVAEELERQKRKTKLADTQNYPDIDLIASYAHRENFDDYMNFGFSISLPMYGKEDVLEEKAKVEELQTQAKRKDIENFVDNKIKEQYAILKAQYWIYKIITEETMPQILHMLELSESMLSSGASLFEYIDILERKLRLDEQRIESVAKFYSAQAKIEELKGELR